MPTAIPKEARPLTARGGRGGGGVRMLGIKTSPMIALALTIPMVVFLMILYMGYFFISQQTADGNLLHPPEHPMHVIANPLQAINIAQQQQQQQNLKPHAATADQNTHINEQKPPPQHQHAHDNLINGRKHGVEKESIGTTNVEYHIVFSTGCSAFQDWQSYVFFYQAMKIQQPGTVTRIVSGCDETEEATLRQIFEETIVPMAPDHFKIHFTPDYAKILKPGINYPYFNKPCGMKDWLQSLGFPDNPINEDAIVVLMDPDQLIMRPFRNNDFSNTEWLHIDKSKKPRTRIEHGAPMGQRYGFSLQWLSKVNMKHVAGPNDLPSPVETMDTKDANAGYVVGPPYIATARDMFAICDKWCEFAPRVHDEYPHLLAEMFAYCLAAAHLELFHQTAASFMVSAVESGGEGWKYIDNLPDDEVCKADEIDQEALPNVLHFCQRYGWGPYFFGKRKLPHSFLTCDSPMLQDPPTSLWKDYDAADFPGHNTKQFKPRAAKQNVFIVCYMIDALNEAAAYYKQHHCNSTANLEHSMILSKIH